MRCPVSTLLSPDPPIRCKVVKTSIWLCYFLLQNRNIVCLPVWVFVHVDVSKPRPISYSFNPQVKLFFLGHILDSLRAFWACLSDWVCCASQSHLKTWKPVEFKNRFYWHCCKPRLHWNSRLMQCSDCTWSSNSFVNSRRRRKIYPWLCIKLWADASAVQLIFICADAKSVPLKCFASLSIHMLSNLLGFHL